MDSTNRSLSKLTQETESSKRKKRNFKNLALQAFSPSKTMPKRSAFTQFKTKGQVLASIMQTPTKMIDLSADSSTEDTGKTPSSSTHLSGSKTNRSTGRYDFSRTFELAKPKKRVVALQKKFISKKDDIKKLSTNSTTRMPKLQTAASVKSFDVQAVKKRGSLTQNTISYMNKLSGKLAKDPETPSTKKCLNKTERFTIPKQHNPTTCRKRIGSKAHEEIKSQMNQKVTTTKKINKNQQAALDRDKAKPGSSFRKSRPTVRGLGRNKTSPGVLEQAGATSQKLIQEKVQKNQKELEQPKISKQVEAPEELLKIEESLKRGEEALSLKETETLNFTEETKTSEAQKTNSEKDSIQDYSHQNKKDTHCEKKEAQKCSAKESLIADSAKKREDETEETKVCDEQDTIKNNTTQNIKENKPNCKEEKKKEFKDKTKILEEKKVSTPASDQFKTSPSPSQNLQNSSKITNQKSNNPTLTQNSVSNTQKLSKNSPSNSLPSKSPISKTISKPKSSIDPKLTNPAKPTSPKFQKPISSVLFRVRYVTVPGQDLYISGDIKELGEWTKTDLGLPMRWTADHIWVAKWSTEELPKKFSFRFIVEEIDKSITAEDRDVRLFNLTKIEAALKKVRDNKGVQGIAIDEGSTLLAFDETQTTAVLAYLWEE